MLLAYLSTSFQSLPLLPKSKLGPVVLIPRWVGLCRFWDPVGLSNKFPCEAGSFSCCHSPHRCFQSEILRLYFSMLEPWISSSVLLPSCSSWLSSHRSGTTCSASHHLAHLGPLACCETSPSQLPSPPLLPVWMNISSLTPWLSDFHIVRFSGSSGYLLFLCLLLNF